MKIKFFLLIFLFNIVLMNTFTEDAIIKNNKATLVETGFYDNDYIFYGSELSFKGKADDLYFFGEKLNFTGDTKSSLTAMGNYININGKTGNNIVIGARIIDINGKINGTCFLFGEIITIDKDTIINGTIFSMAREVIIKGKINGNIYAGTGILIINGEINGNVKASTGVINFQDNGKINGNFFYESEKDISTIDKSKITGTTNFTKWNKKGHFNPLCKKESKSIGIFIKTIFIIFILISFIIGGLLLLLFPVMKKIEEERNLKQFWFTSLWGLIPFLIYPVVIIILFALVITLPVSIMLFMLSIPIIFITTILGISLFGQYLMNTTFKWNVQNRFLFFLFGLIFFSILMLIPILNMLGMMFFSSLGWGLIIEGLFKRKLG